MRAFIARLPTRFPLQEQLRGRRMSDCPTIAPSITSRFPGRCLCAQLRRCRRDRSPRDTLSDVPQEACSRLEDMPMDSPPSRGAAGERTPSVE